MLSVMLVCAVVASLGLGVGMAHGLCVLMFELFRIHAQQVAGTRAVRSQASAPGTL